MEVSQVLIPLLELTFLSGSEAFLGIAHCNGDLAIGGGTGGEPIALKLARSDREGEFGTGGRFPQNFTQGGHSSSPGELFVVHVADNVANL